MHPVDAMFWIVFVAWLTNVLPGWTVGVAFAIMVIHEADKEKPGGHTGE